MFRALLALCAVLCLPACSGSAREEQREARTGLGGPGAATRQFTLPSKNIGCLITAEGARCDIADKAWKPPAKPGDCDLDWGGALAVAADGATLVCAGDTVLGSAEILQYGSAARVGEFECASASEGVRCTHAPSGHGFTLARAGYTIF